MSATVDVGDAIELTFEVTTGAAVTVTWLNPAGVAVLDNVPVPENPAGSGKFPYVFVPTSANVWTAIFTASGAAIAVEQFHVNALPVGGPPPLATVGDVAELFGTLNAAQTGLATALLRHASRMVRSAYPDLDERIASGDLPTAQVALAVVQMVMRVLRNPTGLRSETVGPFTRTFDTGAAAGQLAITDAEAALLAAPFDEPTGARTIRVVAGLGPPPYDPLGRGNRDVFRW